MSEKTYEMLWDCKRCGTKKLLGLTHRYCPNCGGPQNPKDRYFPDEAEKVEVINHAYYGVDVICFHCNSANSRKNSNCVNCGAPLTDGDDVEATLISKSPSVIEKTNDKKSPFFKRHKIIKLITVVVGIVVGIAGWISLNTKEISAQISDYQWNTTVRIEEFKVVSSSEWADAIPSDAYNRVCYSKHHHDDKVVSGSHQECSSRNVDNGDGTYREIESCKTVNEYESIPIYKSYCNFKINRWAFLKNRNASGTHGQAIKYNALPATETCSSNIFGCRREAGSNLYYSATLKTLAPSKVDIATCHIDKQLYDLHPEVVKVKIKFNDIQCGSISFKTE